MKCWAQMLYGYHMVCYAMLLRCFSENKIDVCNTKTAVQQGSCCDVFHFALQLRSLFG
jgi:hypothetical protein